MKTDEKFIEFLTNLKNGLYESEENNRPIDDIDLLHLSKYLERKHGRWIDERRDDFSASVKCSCCNYSFFFVLKGQLNIDKMPYCPNCGAKMDEVSK